MVSAQAIVVMLDDIVQQYSLLQYLQPKYLVATLLQYATVRVSQNWKYLFDLQNRQKHEEELQFFAKVLCDKVNSCRFQDLSNTNQIELLNEFNCSSNIALPRLPQLAIGFLTKLYEAMHFEEGQINEMQSLTDLGNFMVGAYKDLMAQDSAIWNGPIALEMVELARFPFAKPYTELSEYECIEYFNTSDIEDKLSNLRTLEKEQKIVVEKLHKTIADEEKKLKYFAREALKVKICRAQRAEENHFFREIKTRAEEYGCDTITYTSMLVSTEELLWDFIAEKELDTTPLLLLKQLLHADNDAREQVGGSQNNK